MSDEKISLLLIDDEPEILEILAEFVADLNFEVQTAPDAESAFALMTDHPVDLVVSDIFMSKMDGVQLASKIKQTYPQTIVLLISGMASRDILERAISVGVFDFLAKPIEKELFVNRIKRAAEMVAMRKVESRIFDLLFDYLGRPRVSSVYAMPAGPRHTFMRGLLDSFEDAMQQSRQK